MSSVLELNELNTGSHQLVVVNIPPTSTYDEIVKFIQLKTDCAIDVCCLL